MITLSNRSTTGLPPNSLNFKRITPKLHRNIAESYNTYHYHIYTRERNNHIFNSNEEGRILQSGGAGSELHGQLSPAFTFFMSLDFLRTHCVM